MVWRNCKAFNEPSSDVYKDCEELSGFIEEIWRQARLDRGLQVCPHLHNYKFPDAEIAWGLLGSYSAGGPSSGSCQARRKPVEARFGGVYSNKTCIFEGCAQKILLTPIANRACLSEDVCGGRGGGGSTEFHQRIGISQLRSSS